MDWAYEVWDELKEMTRQGDNHQRTIAVQILCNLAKSDPKGRILKDFDALRALIRYDISVALKKLYDEVKDEKIRETALALIETEADFKHRKKYAGVWKTK